MQFWNINIADINRLLIRSLCAIFLLVAELTAATLPGTIIRNQALLTYEDSITGQLVEVVSNTTTISVSEYPSFQLSGQHTVTLEPGIEHTFAHQLYNNGNVSDSFTLSASANSQDTGLSVVILTITVDDNGNGVVDSDELPVDAALTLSPEQSIDLLVSVAVPPDAVINTTHSVTLNGQNSHGLLQETGNTVVVESGAVFTLVKSSSPGCHVALFPGDVVSHEVEISNTGGASVNGINLLLDGDRVSGVVVEHPLPSLMRFENFEQPLNLNTALPVLRLSGVADNSWISQSLWNETAAVASVGLFYPHGTFAPQSRDTFRFTTVVDIYYSGISREVSSASVDNDGDERSDYESNRTCHLYSTPNAAREAVLEFIDPAFAVRGDGLADFNSDADFVAAIQYPLAGDVTDGYQAALDGVYLQLNLSGDLNRSGNIRIDANRQRYLDVVVESSLTGDQLTVVLLETSTDGVFRSMSPVVLTQDRRSDGGFCPGIVASTAMLNPEFENPADTCILASTNNDELVARYVDAQVGFTTSDVALVNPQAMVFNAQTGLPVAGAKVTIRDAATGVAVTSRVTGLPFEFLTGGNGLYTMPRLESVNSYYIDVEPPVSHSFPSLTDSAELQRFNIAEASYGLTGAPGGSGDGIFRIDGSLLNRPVDIPLDSNLTDVLLALEKTAHLAEVETGQVVSYTVTLKNLDSEILSSVELMDRPPFGYRYVPLSATVSGEPVSDPDFSASGQLLFEVGDFEPGAAVSVGYSLRATAAAIDSDGVNEATATAVNNANAQVVSPTSRAAVRIKKQGVLSDRAALFGKIYVDQDCNAMQTDKEWPVGGVRLYLQDGTYTITDTDGLYSFYGLAPGRHVLKVDNYSLPNALELKPIDSNQAVDPDSRFVELMAGDFYRADFAAMCPDEDTELLFAEIKARNESINGSWLLKEAEQFQAGENMPVADPASRVKSPDGDLSSGLLHGAVLDETGSASLPAESAVIKKIISSQKREQTPLPDPKKLVSKITYKQAKDGTWIWPANDLSIRGRFMAVVRDGIEPTLYVNDNPVAASQIGERLANRREKAQIVAWYGVELRAGDNKVEVKGTDPFGNSRVLASGVFKKPSSGTSIKLELSADTVAADGGRSTLPVKIKIFDSHGLPALGAYFVTLENSDGGWLEPDIQDAEPGRQIRIDGGERIVHYVSSEQTGEVELRVSTGEFSDEKIVLQVTEARPLIAIGLLEAGATLSQASFGEFKPSKPLAGLDGKSHLHARGSVFVKGWIRNRFNLTFAYDSEKESKKQLLRDINPSMHYPVHGDASVRGFEAQSRSKLYLKVEEDKNSFMWGDFLTDSSSDHEDLARSRRTLTGFNGIVDSEHGRFRLFASRQQDQNVSEEVRGNGSAMLYRLQTYPIVSNSEVVELVTRSRDNEGLVVARTKLSRFGDYSIDPVLGYVTFSKVIPTLDDNQNPVFIQISYDVETNGSNYWVTGLRFDRRINDQLKFGLSHTSDHHSENGVRQTGAYATYQAGEDTRISTSYAGSNSIANGSGNAARVSVDHRWSADSRTTFTYARADSQFTNSGASIAPGRVEARLNHRRTLNNKTTIAFDALQSNSIIGADDRRTIGAQIESRLREWLVRIGLRQITQEEFSGKDQFVTAIVGVNRQIVIGEKSGQVEAELEQDTSRTSRRRIKLGGKLQVHDKARVYSHYELANSLLSLSGSADNQKTETLTLGVESDVLPSTRLYSEYRMRGAFNDRSYETASGIRADLELQPDLRVTPNFEVINSQGVGDSLAASVAITDTRNKNSRKLLRVEARHSDSTDYVGLRGSYAARMNEDWTGVFTENLSAQKNTGTEDTLRHSFVAGLSRRPKLDNKHHMLLMYNWKEEKGVSPGIRRRVHLLSTHQNIQLENKALLSGRFGGKQVRTGFQGRYTKSFTMLADARLNFDFDRRFNVDLRAGLLTTGSSSQFRYSAGAGLYYVFNKNARIGIGYNFGGFRDKDLDAEEYFAQGWQFGLQYKFDEDALRWLE